MYHISHMAIFKQIKYSVFCFRGLATVLGKYASHTAGAQAESSVTWWKWQKVFLWCAVSKVVVMGDHSLRRRSRNRRGKRRYIGPWDHYWWLAEMNISVFLLTLSPPSACPPPPSISVILVLFIASVLNPPALFTCFETPVPNVCVRGGVLMGCRRQRDRLGESMYMRLES